VKQEYIVPTQISLSFNSYLPDPLELAGFVHDNINNNILHFPFNHLHLYLKTQFLRYFDYNFPMFLSRVD